MKMESNKENREALLTALKEKLKKTDDKITAIKQLKMETTQLLDDKIKNKLIFATGNRIEKLTAITERMKEHEKHVENVKKNCKTNMKDVDLEEKIIAKLQNALNFREEQLEKIKDRIRDHEKHAAEVREKALERSETNGEAAEI